MTTSDSSDGPAAPADGPQRNRRMSLRRKISLKFKEFQGFVNEYSENVSAGGMFIRTPSPQPQGTVFDFEFTLGDDYRLIHGIGEVVWTREDDEGFDRPAGMGVRFLSLDPDSRKLIDRMVDERLAREASRAAPPPADSDRPWGDLSPPGDAAAALPAEEPAWEGAAAPGSEVAAAAGLDRDLDRPPLLFPSDAAPEAPPSDGADGAFPRRTGPSPYAYARSYQGSGVAARSRRRSPLLVVLLVIALLVAALAAFFLIFQETAVSLLTGGGGDERLVELRPSGAEGGASESAPGEESEPVEPVPRAQAEGVLSPGLETAPEAGSGTETDAEAAAANEEGDRELGFFEPAPTQPQGKARTPGQAGEAAKAPAPAPPAPAPAPAPVPAPSPAPASRAGAPAPSAYSRVLNVVWEPRGEEVLVTVHLDGAIAEWDYSTVRLDGPPREVVRIDGVDQAFPRTEIPVGTALLERIRVGFHPEGRTSQIHLVLDLATPEAQIDRTEAAGSELRIFLARGDG